jgi:PAS domain S-box-containing protein
MLKLKEVGADGKPRFFLNNSVGIIEAGKLTSFWGTQIDITEAKKREESFTRTEALLRAMFDTCNEAVLLMDKGVFVDFNKQSELLSGFNRNELLEKSVDFLLGESYQLLDNDQARNGFQRLEITQKNGKKFDVEATLKTLVILNKEMKLLSLRKLS